MTISLNHLLTSDRIPSLPEVALKVVEAAQRPEPEFSELAELIKGDPAICSRIMRTVNSALFGLRQRVSSIDAAIPVLGVNLVRTLVLSFTLAEHRGSSDRLKPYYQRLWRGSITQAVAAETMALESKGIDESVWFLGALLQDIGRIALLSEAPDTYQTILDNCSDDQQLLEAEHNAFGFTHVDVSTQLCVRWRLDNFLVDGVSKHHQHVVTADPEVYPLNTVAYLPNSLRCASLFNNFLESLRDGGNPDRGSLEIALSEGFSIGPDEVDDLLKDSEKRSEEIAALFSVDLGDYVPVERLLANAKATLSQIALESQLEINAVHRHIEDAKRELENVRVESSKLKREAQTDDLTGAFTRKVFPEVMESAIEYCHEENLLLGLLFIDVDSFKSLNDGYGHQVGDSVLRSVIEAIQLVVRRKDVIVRYGGDEFVVVLPVPNDSLLVDFAERIRKAVAKMKTDMDAELKVTCSIGAVSADVDIKNPPSTDRLLTEADKAMYKAKDVGGNQVIAVNLRGNVVSRISVNPTAPPLDSTDTTPWDPHTL